MYVVYVLNCSYCLNMAESRETEETLLHSLNSCSHTEAIFSFPTEPLSSSLLIIVIIYLSLVSVFPRHFGEIHLPVVCHSPVSEKPGALVALLLAHSGTKRSIYVPSVIRRSYCSSIVTPLRPVLLGKKQTVQIILVYKRWAFFVTSSEILCTDRDFFFPHEC